MKQEVLDKINLALDHAMAKFRDDPDVIYPTEIDRLKLKYADNDKLKDWAKNKNCIFDGCKKKSISKSHTIQKSSSIKQISENGQVLTPKLNQTSGELELISQGIGDASTFPGFCEDHEKLFSEFENKKDLVNEVHFILQVYRTICREIVVAERNLETLTLARNAYVEYRNKKVEELFVLELGADFMVRNDIQSKGLKMKGGDSREAQAKKGISMLTDYLNSLRHLKNAISNDVKKKRFQKTACISLVIDAEFPVCIAGRGNFKIKQKEKTKSIEIIFNVLPHPKKTYIVICSLKKFSKDIQFYMDHFKNPLQIMSLIESWMVHGSDHWFIKPSEWAKVDVSRRSQILKDLHDLSKNTAYDYPHSIFDDLRKASIKLMDDNYDQLNEQLIELLERERKKLGTAANL